MEEELDAVMKKFKSRKAVDLYEIPPRTTRKFDAILLQLCNTVYKINTIEKWIKAASFPSTKKATLKFNNYRGITLPAIASKVYNSLFFIFSDLQLRKFFIRTRIAFGEINLTTLQIMIMTIHLIIVHAKSL